MKWQLGWLGVAALLIGSEAVAESCLIEITGPKEQWKFVHAYDTATGKIVLQKAIKAGNRREARVSGQHVRVDWKLAGDKGYTRGRTQLCKGGNIIKI